ncbi:hypothetical protein B0T16DRAFT_9356 [Cercophora newfieldiana]|uniref:Uncharacterized protein n=1 Tax=Cercophora newfieldiana TaxID=92897 RepID=A0AA40CXS7_9PEZI|nr:hypothetical protein B0T16DRAFT_9356 [Cercophora newfieldiana]
MQVATKVAQRFNPNVKIVAHHGNIRTLSSTSTSLRVSPSSSMRSTTSRRDAM